jgi:hypothetical protein
MTKMSATIRVEFELKEGQPENVATAALQRGKGELARAIEHGVTGVGSTGVKQGSVRVDILKQNIE